MRKIATSLLLLALSIVTYAQTPVIDSTYKSGGPDGYGYSWISSESKIDTAWCIGCDSSVMVRIDTVATIDDLWFDTIPSGTFMVGSSTFNADSYFASDTIYLTGTQDTVVGVSSDTLTSTDTIAVLLYVTTIDTYDTIYGDSISTITGVQGPAFNWIDISATGTEIGPSCDDCTDGPFTVGFSMPFYWYDITNYYVGANGYLVFDKKANISSGNNPSFPYFPTSTDNFDNLLAPFMADLSFAGSGNPGKVYQYSNGTDSLIITYENVPFYDGSMANDFGGSNTFQIILSKVDTTMTFNYLSTSGTWASGYDGDPGAAQIGMESVGAIAGLQVASGRYFKENFSVVISLNANQTFSVRDITSAGNNGTKNGGVFVTSRDETTFSTNVKNIGTADEASSFNVNTQIAERQNGANAIYESSESISSINANTLTEVTFANAFNPSDASTLIDGEVAELGKSYFMVTELVITDDNNANNEIFSEVVVLADSSLSQVNMSYVDMAADPAGVGAYGFEGGGVYFKPPYYPITIIAIDYLVLTGGQAPASGFFARVWDDDGANGTPGTMIADNDVTGGQINTDDPQGITTVFLPNTVTITEGGFYVGFEDQGAGGDKALATEGGTSQIPLSGQNYEVLNGSWGEYRSNTVEDLMINVLVDASATKSIEEQIASLKVGEVYPNPANDLVSVKVSLDNASNVNCSIKNVIGQEVKSENLGMINTGEKAVSFDVSELETGIYFFTLTSNGETHTKKFVVK